MLFAVSVNIPVFVFFLEIFYSDCGYHQTNFLAVCGFKRDVKTFLMVCEVAVCGLRFQPLEYSVRFAVAMLV